MSLFFLDGFAQRQWKPEYQGTRIAFDQEEFTRRINEACQDEAELVEGYAPFCKHVFVPNFVGATVPVLAITPENESLLRSGYQARTEAVRAAAYSPSQFLAHPSAIAAHGAIVHCRSCPC